MSYLGGRTIYIDSDGNEYYDYERDYEPKPITNADRIRAMSDDELASFLHTANGCPMWVSEYLCKEDKGCAGAMGACWLDWLKQEADHA